MNRALTRAFSRNNWYLFAGAGLIVLIVLYQGVGGGGGVKDTAGSVADNRPSILPERVNIAPEDFRPKPPPVRATEAEKAQVIIAGYEEKLEQNPAPEDRAVYLQAMANLYRQKLMDYKKAAQYYEWLIEDYPDMPQIGMIYSQLGLCYEKLEDQESANRLYQKMVRRFPENSQEHLFAKQKLGW